MLRLLTRVSRYFVLSILNKLPVSKYLEGSGCPSEGVDTVITGILLSLPECWG